MSGALPASAQRVRDELRRLGLDSEIVEFDRSTRTSAEAAAAIGCEVGQIAKSLVFRGHPSGRPVLAIASGVNRVDEALVAESLGEAIQRADADFVREKTGFSIGGVPPFGHVEQPAAFIDRDLMAWPQVWAAAGTPNTVFRLAPEELVAISGGRVIVLKVEKG